MKNYSENEPQNDPLDDALTEALDGETLRSQDWKRLVGALEIRRQRLERDAANAENSIERQLIEGQIEEIDGQIAVLQEEAGISQFIEDTVKFSYQVHKLGEG